MNNNDLWINERVLELAKLKPGWDIDENAPAPNVTALMKTSIIVKALFENCNKLPITIEPDALGGIDIYYENNNINMDVIVWNERIVTIYGRLKETVGSFTYENTNIVGIIDFCSRIIFAKKNEILPFMNTNLIL
jgi:hypothetical protein